MKKIISLLLAVIMVASLFPVMALADPIAITAAGGALSAGGYVLNSDVNLTSNLTVDVGSDNTVTIDLQGHVLKGTGNGPVISVTSGTLILNDSTPTTEHVGYVDANGLWHWDKDSNHVLQTGETTKMVTGGVITGGCGKNIDYVFYGGGVYISGGSFVMNGGNIAGCSATKGGGVYVDNNGTFTMKNGNISENTATIDGGGVYISGSSFVMNGGTIAGNTAANGGGVCNYYGTFTMNNGNIAGNTATNKDGGGVCNYYGTFTMNNGTISDNTAANGGGVCNWGGTFTMENGNISENTASFGGGVYANGTFTMKNGNISENTATIDGGGVYNSSYDTFTMKNGTISANMAASGGGGVYANGTITLGGEAKITDNVIGGTISGDVLTDGTANNVFLPNYKYITLDTTTKPTGSFKVGVTTQTAPTDGVPVKFTTNGASTDTKYFTSDKNAYEVNFNTDHLELRVPEEVPEHEEPEPERRSYTTVTIGDRDDKEETEAEETVEENPNTGAPVMDLGAVAVVLGAVYVVFKKH